MLLLNNFEPVDAGGNACIFKLSGTNVAIKLFKSYDHIDFLGHSRDQETINLKNFNKVKVFETERDAYIKAQASEVLRKITPTYHGTITIDGIFNLDGIDISKCFLLSCCISIGFVEGQNMKFEEFKSNNMFNNYGFNRDEIINEFHEYGINYLHDSQVIYSDREFRIIDFATVDRSDVEIIL